MYAGLTVVLPQEISSANNMFLSKNKRRQPNEMV